MMNFVITESPDQERSLDESLDPSVNQVINGHHPTIPAGRTICWPPQHLPCGFPWSIELGREPAMAGKSHQTRPGTKMYKEYLRMCQTLAQLAQLSQVAQAFLIS